MDGAVLTGLLDDLRACGLPMGARYAPAPFTDPLTEATGTAQRFISWTTDESKDASREAGATVIEYLSTDPRFNGWEVTARIVEWD